METEMTTNEPVSVKTITLNDGTILVGTVLPDGEGIKIFVYLDKYPLLNGVVLFSDPEKTSRIIAMSYGHEYIYEGFTEVIAANNEYGNCNLVMRRPVNAT